ncbi:MAG: ferrous iron transport protein B [Anaerolineae bacterium]|nr:ferrous iron transport protein B [Anaerolineae bacterium]
MVMQKGMTVALAGNPNSGKTSIFNALTGARQHVGNWPGVTVERKEGHFTYAGVHVTVVDLPGIYGLTSYSLDERIARDFLLHGKPDLVVAVVDTTNLERNLYLVLQLLELGVPVVLDLNMMDEIARKGIEIDTVALGQALGVRVVTTVANQEEGIEALKEAIVESEQHHPAPTFKLDYGPPVEEEITRLQNMLERSTNLDGYSSRWMAIKLLEGDPEAQRQLKGQPQEEEIMSTVMAATVRLEGRLEDGDIEMALVERRYGFLNGLAKAIIRRKTGMERRLDISERIDRIVLNKYLGIPIFLTLLWGAFQLIFTLGGPVADLVDAFFTWLGEASAKGILALGAPEWAASLVADGIIGGIGSVLVFLPNILLLFLVIAILEDSGYMARAAFVMDRLMHALGLHGKSFIPLILGFGCNVPAIMATRTLSSEKDRILTILINPFISCSARLPIYVLFAGAFFAQAQGLIIFSLYVLGIIVAIGTALLFRRLFFAHEIAPLVMELPPYRLPSVRSVLIHMWERSRLFLTKAGTIIAITVILVWALASLPPGVEYASEASLIGGLGRLLAPLLAPAGFGFWQAAVALFFGILAKEVVVGTLGTLYGGEATLTVAIQSAFTPVSAYAFMVMSLIYIPCIATIGAIRREAGWRWALLSVTYSLLLGWLLAVIIFQLGQLLRLA